MTSRRGFVAILAVLGLMVITVYLAVAFPYTISFLKQSDTSEIKSVIVIGRSGEKTPLPESYFIGEDPPEELAELGHEQLTNTGKDRMFMLGKFLKLRYYHLLLDGNPRRIYARASDTDRSLQSAQALLAGLNPPKDKWVWSSTGDLANWQPIAVHTSSADSDDLLSMEPNCPRLEQAKLEWKNSTRYLQLVSEFRHDLETLRVNTGLEFEDDLEMLINIEDSLRTRLAYKGTVPAWYSPVFASRLAHIADAASESRHKSEETQRLYVGRLLHEMLAKINAKIRADDNTSSEPRGPQSNHVKSKQKQHQQDIDSSRSLKSTTAGGAASVYLYMAGKQRLAALLNSLQIYSSLQFGSLLLIELHYDPINQLHFLRLFTVNSNSPNVFPEPLRVNPAACLESSECSPQQFEQNIRHLMVDKSSWLDTCSRHAPQELPAITSTTPVPPSPVGPLQQPSQSTTTSSSPISDNDYSSTTTASSSLDKLDASLLVGPNIETQPDTHLEPRPPNDSSSKSTTPTIDQDSSSHRQESTNQLVEPSAPTNTTAIADQHQGFASTTPADTTDHVPHEQMKNEIKIGDADTSSGNSYHANHLTRDIYYPENKL